MCMNKPKPSIIEKVGFDFSWDEHKVWELDFPTETMPIDKLIWHLDTPFIWSKPDGYYDVRPREVIDSPEKYTEEYERILAVDTNYPIDIMWWRERWLILDGLHRLMKKVIEGSDDVQVRKIPESAIPLIRIAK